jgi:hypothetical protein
VPVLKRQFISDAAGTPVGVILTMEEYTLVADTLEQRLMARLDAKLAKWSRRLTIRSSWLISRKCRRHLNAAQDSNVLSG